MKVAELCNPVWFAHYKKIRQGFTMSSEAERRKFFAAFDAKTVRLIEEKRVSEKLVEFCLQPDTGGAIHYGACKEILKGIGLYSSKIECYGYTGSRPASFDSLKRLLRECSEHKCDLIWRSS